jgi:hypothetical protein
MDVATKYSSFNGTCTVAAIRNRDRNKQCKLVCCFPCRFLELSLPKFSMTSLTDLRSLLFDMAAVIEKSLLGSDAEFERLSSKKPFSVDKVRSRFPP